ncbi:MAG: virulence RhuM family protein [Clostridia bacterium]|nr:virulence RhuM family protein [Clostridia bacterium]
MEEKNKSELIIYQTEDGETKINVTLENETVWLTQAQMAELFQHTPQNITTHIKNIYEEGELDINSTCKEFLQVQTEGSREVKRSVKFYNLDVIISVGYRVKSKRGTQFRIWANKVLKEYLIKGFTMDDERLKQYGGGNYWKELLDRIRDIRSSEKMLYRQVLDLYATAVDYDPHSDKSISFFKIVQNKLHYAAHGHTAAEVIYQRADAEKPFMGLTSFSGELPALKDIGIAKNYLTETELKVLNNLVSGYFDFAEIQAMEHKPVYMEDYISRLDAILSSTGRKILNGAGTVSHDVAIKKAESEYRKYQEQTITPVEQAYLDTIKSAQKTAEKQLKNKK